MTTLFITGSGTGVGKTFVCCRLIERLRGESAIRCIKPVVTGFDPAAPEASDTGRLLEARDRQIDAAGIEATSPWRFRAALSADMAAEREGRHVPFDELTAFSRSPPGTSLNLIEGIGGVMAPLDDRHTVLDWIGALDAKPLLVVGSYLGSLSHALTAIEVLRARNLTPLAVVISQSVTEPVPMEETSASLARHSGDIPIVTVPRGERPAADSSAARILRLLKPQ